MPRTFTADRPGPLPLDLDMGLGEIHVLTEEREFAELTLEPTNPNDATAHDLISRAAESADNGTFGLLLPRPAGASSARQSVQAGHIHGVVVSSARGVVVNGQYIAPTASAGAVTVTARVPHRSSVAVRTTSCDLLTTGALTRVAYQSESGGLTVEQATTVEAQTVSGSVSITNAATVRANITSGSILLDHVEEITARSVSGTVDITGLRGTGRVESVSGSVHAHAVADAELAASTVSGAIRLTAADDVTFSTRTSTISGRIHQPANQWWSA